MGTREIWEIETKIRVDIISCKPSHRLEQMHDPNLLKVELSPMNVGDDSPKDIFLFKIQFAFPSSTDDKESPISIVNMGKLLLNGMISRLAFLANTPIIVLSPPTFTHHYPDSNKFRKIFLPEEQVSIHPPITIDNFDLMNSIIDPRITTALNFSHASLTTPDLIGSFVYLWSALEILVNLFEIEEFDSKKCEKCGFEYQKNPGIKDRIKYVLHHELSIDDEVINKIWEIRNNISHHGLILSQYELLDVEVNRNKLYLFTRKLIGLQIGNTSILLSNDIPFLFFSVPFLDVEYTK